MKYVEKVVNLMSRSYLSRVTNEKAFACHSISKLLYITLKTQFALFLNRALFYEDVIKNSSSVDKTWKSCYSR